MLAAPLPAAGLGSRTQRRSRLTLEPEEIARRILTGAEALEKTGALSVDEVLTLSFVSPACGTGALPVEVAERCFRLSAETSAWLRARA